MNHLPLTVIAVESQAGTPAQVAELRNQIESAGATFLATKNLSVAEVLDLISLKHLTAIEPFLGLNRVYSKFLTNIIVRFYFLICGLMNGCGMVLPTPGGGSGGPYWDPLQIPFPYVPYA